MNIPPFANRDTRSSVASAAIPHAPDISNSLPQLPQAPLRQGSRQPPEQQSTQALNEAIQPRQNLDQPVQLSDHIFIQPPAQQPRPYAANPMTSSHLQGSIYGNTFASSSFAQPSSAPQHNLYSSSHPTWNAINRQDTTEEEANENDDVGGGRDEVDEQATATLNKLRYRDFSAHLTAEHWARDFAAAQEGKTGNNKANKAHVELINGTYGVTASKPCAHCANQCRIYHPGLKFKVSRYMGKTCAGCRTKWKSGGCGAE
jgi:hypothetical protein